jgi:hypothetical protein
VFGRELHVLFDLQPVRSAASGAVDGVNLGA